MGMLDGKVAIVTGASAGIGRAAALLFAEQGASVVLAARREPLLQELVSEIRAKGGNAVALSGDVASEEYNKALVELALSKFGKLDIAFNNAGTLGWPGAITDLSLDNWSQTLSTNLTSGFLAAKYQVPAMVAAGGSIIFTSSFVGYEMGMPHQSAYAASKAGIIGLVKTLASEYGAEGIRVNALLPGGTYTGMAKEFGDSPEVKEFVRNIHALKRTASPEEIAMTALYLASDLSSFTTGTALLADGGVSVSKT